MPQLQLKLFAGFRLLNQKGKVLSGLSRKAKALLAWLALNPDHEHPREKLAGVLWPDSNITKARHSLRQALTDLRKVLPKNSSILHTNKDWIMFNGDKIKVDVLDFKHALENDDLGSLEIAINLYQGELLDGCNPHSDSFDDWLLFYRRNYSERIVFNIEKHLKLLIKKAEYDNVIYFASRLIEIDPVQESAYQALMLAHCKLGNHSNSLKWYQKITERLQQELSLTPSPETQSLYQKILAAHASNDTNSNNLDESLTHTEKNRSLSNSNERFLYQLDISVRGALEHKIGHSYLVRTTPKKLTVIVEDIIQQIGRKQFAYYRKQITKDQKKQETLINLLQVLATYLKEPRYLIDLQKEPDISLRALSMLKRISSRQPVLLLIESMQNSSSDLMRQLAKFSSLIGNHAILLIMVGDLKNNDDPLRTLWQNNIAGTPLTSLDL